MNYPYDIISYVRNKTFSIEARFAEEKEESPLKVFNNKFSRFVFTVISDSKAATCNIHLQDLAGITSRSNYAFNKHMDVKYASNVASDNQSPGFTTRFAAGSLKGKTPVEVLLENGDNAKDMLNSQYNWLKSNLDKYPGNQKLMDAIIDASKIDLSSITQHVSNNKPIEIINIGARPLVRRQREDKKCFCYECSVIWDSSKDYPVSVTVKNYYAPVIEKENGLLNVVMKEKDQKSEISNTFNMTADEWINAVEEMNAIKDNFRMLHIKEAFVLAEKAERENRENSKAS